MTQHPSLLGACALAAALAGSAAVAQPVGLPSYSATASVDVERGSNYPRYAYITFDQGFNGRGHQVAVAGPQPVQWPNFRPTEAYASASSTELKATAVASGTVFYDENFVPFVHAKARAESTSFWSFGAPWTMGFTALLDGSLSALVGYFEVPGARNDASVRFGLDLLDATGATLAQVFDVQAQLTLGNAADVLKFNASTAGFATGALWNDSAFTKTSDDATSYSGKLAYDIGYIESITTPFSANAGDVYGFRWYLETDSAIEGYSVNAVFAADLGHTAHFGFALSDAERARLGIVELLSFPAAAVPEPATPLMFAGGLALLGWLRVRRPQAV